MKLASCLPVVVIFFIIELCVAQRQSNIHTRGVSIPRRSAIHIGPIPFINNLPPFSPNRHNINRPPGGNLKFHKVELNIGKFPLNPTPKFNNPNPYRLPEIFEPVENVHLDGDELLNDDDGFHDHTKLQNSIPNIIGEFPEDVDFTQLENHPTILDEEEFFDKVDTTKEDNFFDKVQSTKEEESLDKEHTTKVTPKEPLPPPVPTPTTLLAESKDTTQTSPQTEPSSVTQEDPTTTTEDAFIISDPSGLYEQPSIIVTSKSEFHHTREKDGGNPDSNSPLSNFNNFQFEDDKPKRQITNEQYQYYNEENYNDYNPTDYDGTTDDKISSPTLEGDHSTIDIKIKPNKNHHKKAKPHSKQETYTDYEAPVEEPHTKQETYSDYEAPVEGEDEEPDRLTLLLNNSVFTCSDKKDGYYADENLDCEVFHFCQDKLKHSWLCPNGASFHQIHLICMPRTEENICEKSTKFYFVNDYLYKEVSSKDKNVTKAYAERYYPEGFADGIVKLIDEQPEETGFVSRGELNNGYQHELQVDEQKTTDYHEPVDVYQENNPQPAFVDNYRQTTAQYTQAPLRSAYHQVVHGRTLVPNTNNGPIFVNKHSSFSMGFRT